HYGANRELQRETGAHHRGSAAATDRHRISFYRRTGYRAVAPHGHRPAGLSGRHFSFYGQYARAARTIAAITGTGIGHRYPAHVSRRYAQAGAGS
nr:hypothetical protein [Tanacetum cinerariifolium]